MSSITRFVLLAAFAGGVNADAPSISADEQDLTLTPGDNGVINFGLGPAAPAAYGSSISMDALLSEVARLSNELKELKASLPDTYLTNETAAVQYPSRDDLADALAQASEGVFNEVQSSIGGPQATLVARVDALAEDLTDNVATIGGDVIKLSTELNLVVATVNKISACHADGEVLGENDECILAIPTCPSPDAPKNGKVALVDGAQEALVGTQAQYTCDATYYIDAEYSITACTTSKTFAPAEPPVCSPCSKKFGDSCAECSDEACTKCTDGRYWNYKSEKCIAPNAIYMLGGTNSGWNTWEQLVFDENGDFSEQDGWSKAFPVMPTGDNRDSKGGAAAFLTSKKDGGALYIFGGVARAASRLPQRLSKDTLPRWETAASIRGANPVWPIYGTINNKLYLFGGGGDVSNPAVYHSFDGDTRKWSEETKQDQNRYRGCSTVLGNKLYAIGGAITEGSNTAALRRTDVYDPKSKQWSKLDGQAPYRVFDCGAAGLNGKIYVGGGLESTQDINQDVTVKWVGVLNTFYSMDPSNGQWTQLKAMPNSHTEFSMLVFGNKVFAIGSYRPREGERATDLYDPSSNSWTIGPDLNIKRAVSFTAVGPEY